MKLPAISLWQPWASLLFVRRPCDECDAQNCRTADRVNCSCCRGTMVKEWETRAYPPPRTIVNKRVLIHAAKRPFGVSSAQADVVRALDRGTYGRLRDAAPGDIEWTDSGAWPLGALIGSVVIGEGVPILHRSWDQAQGGIIRDGDELWHADPITWQSTGVPGADEPVQSGYRMSEALPFGDWSSGRWAWPLSDPKLLSEWCPWCEGTGIEPPYACAECEACGGDGYLPGPVPYRGRQGVFYVDEEAL